jgi:hypothetical protein
MSGSPGRPDRTRLRRVLSGFVGSHIKRREPAKTPARTPRLGFIGAMAAFHLRWIMEAMARKSPTAVLIAKTSEVLRTGVNGIPVAAMFVDSAFGSGHCRFLTAARRIERAPKDVC